MLQQQQQKDHAATKTEDPAAKILCSQISKIILKNKKTKVKQGLFGKLQVKPKHNSQGQTLSWHLKCELSPKLTRAGF